MARLVVTPKFRSDTREILTYLEQVAGPAVAERYNRHFRKLIDTFVLLPRSGSPRSEFGADIRIGVVEPYLVFYDYREATDTVTLLRILHSRRNITENLLDR